MNIFPLGYLQANFLSSTFAFIGNRFVMSHISKICLEVHTLWVILPFDLKVCWAIVINTNYTRQR